MAISVDQGRLKELLALPATHVDLVVAAEIAVLVIQEDFAGSLVSESRQNQIALFLAAHIGQLSIFRGGLQAMEVMDAKDTFQKQDLGKGYEATIFGQQALALDTSGTLAEQSSGRLKALFDVITPSA